MPPGPPKPPKIQKIHGFLGFRGSGGLGPLFPLLALKGCGQKFNNPMQRLVVPKAVPQGDPPPRKLPQNPR